MSVRDSEYTMSRVRIVGSLCQCELEGLWMHWRKIVIILPLWTMRIVSALCQCEWDGWWTYYVSVSETDNERIISRLRWILSIWLNWRKIVIILPLWTMQIVSALCQCEWDGWWTYYVSVSETDSEHIISRLRWILSIWCEWDWTLFLNGEDISTKADSHIKVFLLRLGLGLLCHTMSAYGAYYIKNERGSGCGVSVWARGMMSILY